MIYVIIFVVCMTWGIIAHIKEEKKKGTWGMTNEEKLLYQKMQIIQSSNLPPDMTLMLAQKASDEFAQDVTNKTNSEKRAKAIATGAIVGGIVGGEVGAAAGAIIANDNAKQQ